MHLLRNVLTVAMLSLFAGCSADSTTGKIHRVRVVGTDGQPIVGALGPTLWKFRGGNISNSQGYLKLPRKGVFSIRKEGYKPLLVNRLNDPVKDVYVLEVIGSSDDPIELLDEHVQELSKLNPIRVLQ